MRLGTETPDLGLSTKHDLGQFFTPTHVADFMASLLRTHYNELSLLDAGAGMGALTAAVVRRLCTAERKPKKITVTAYEVDRTLIENLERTLDRCRRECEVHGIEFHSTVINDDFVENVVSILERNLFSSDMPHFNAAVVNPPYRKLRSDSNARLRLRSIGIETSNFYSAFVALVCRLLADQGELVAITPRSFCNGPYFKPFRSEMLNSMSVQRLHLFDSRSAAFDKDNVLQENLIVHAIKGESKPEKVILSRSTGRPGDKVTEQSIPFSQVVSPNDPEQFIHVPIGQVSATIRENLHRLHWTLEDLKVGVSTGRVVDFRARSFLRKEPGVGTAPLIYPGHFKNGVVDWPKESRKSNAIVVSDHTRDLLVRRGVYVLVKRFTSKEERRRVVACIYDPSLIRAPLVAFENHLNYFHVDGRGLDMNFAKGLSAFLNSTLVDSYFRQFSGHTQVNATDLRRLNYPSKTVLDALGQNITYPVKQDELDALVEAEIFNGN